MVGSQGQGRVATAELSAQEVAEDGVVDHPRQETGQIHPRNLAAHTKNIFFGGVYPPGNWRVPTQVTFEDFPFPQVGYVSFLESIPFPMQSIILGINVSFRGCVLKDNDLLRFENLNDPVSGHFFTIFCWGKL